jgi:hypothetical protein
MSELKRSDIYKDPRAHEVQMPRTGDLAEVVRSHCKQETGLLVQVVGEPHRCTNFCADCGIEVLDYFVEVYQVHAQWWYLMPGPWFIPIKWLKRIDPRDPTKYPRIAQRLYRPLAPTYEQEKAWNPGVQREPWTKVIEIG